MNDAVLLIELEIARLKALIERHTSTSVYLEHRQRWAIELHAIEQLYDKIITLKRR